MTRSLQGALSLVIGVSPTLVIADHASGRCGTAFVDHAGNSVRRFGDVFIDYEDCAMQFNSQGYLAVDVMPLGTEESFTVDALIFMTPEEQRATFFDTAQYNLGHDNEKNSTFHGKWGVTYGEKIDAEEWVHVAMRYEHWSRNVGLCIDGVCSHPVKVNPYRREKEGVMIGAGQDRTEFPYTCCEAGSTVETWTIHPFAGKIKFITQWVGVLTDDEIAQLAQGQMINDRETRFDVALGECGFGQWMRDDHTCRGLGWVDAATTGFESVRVLVVLTLSLYVLF